MSIEVGVLVGINHHPLFWHEPADASAVQLPDSQSLWHHIWQAHQAKQLLGFAHSHPGAGVPHPSHEDITTFAAIEAALGRALLWWITSADCLVVIRRSNMDSIRMREVYAITSMEARNEPGWTTELRRRSVVSEWPGRTRP